MNQFVGYFLHSEQGRQFIVQVPGVATSALSDAELAELINWMLLTYSAAQLPEDFKPYETAEVRRLRAELEPDPTTRRASVLAEIGDRKPELAERLKQPWQN